MIFISNILFNLQLFDIYDAKIQYFFSHNFTITRKICISRHIFNNSSHLLEQTAYSWDTISHHNPWNPQQYLFALLHKMVYEISPDIFTLFPEISIQFIRSDKAQGCKRLLFRHNICVADREEVRGFSSKNHLSHVFWGLLEEDFDAFCAFTEVWHRRRCLFWNAVSNWFSAF